MDTSKRPKPPLFKAGEPIRVGKKGTFPNKATQFGPNYEPSKGPGRRSRAERFIKNLPVIDTYTPETVEQIVAKWGRDPLDILLELAVNSDSEKIRMRAAADAAKYCRPQLKAIEHSGSAITQLTITLPTSDFFSFGNSNAPAVIDAIEHVPEQPLELDTTVHDFVPVEDKDDEDAD